MKSFDSRKIVPCVLLAAAVLQAGSASRAGRALASDEQAYIARGAFRVAVSPNLRIEYDGVPLIVGDVAATGDESGADVEPRDGEALDVSAGTLTREGDTITTQVLTQDRYFRREVHLREDGALELTYEIRLYGFTGRRYIQYRLLAGEAFDGAYLINYRGRLSQNVKSRSRTFESSKFNGPSEVDGGIRLMQVRDAELGELSVDFNPEGPWLCAADMQTAVRGYVGGVRGQGLWLTQRQIARWGHNLHGKIVIHPGIRDYDALHPVDRIFYKHPFPPPDTAINFTEGPGDGTFQAVKPAVDAPADAPARWLTPVRCVTRDGGTFLYGDFASSAADGRTGEVEVPLRDGWYLLTLYACDMAEATGPFSVSGPEGPIAEGVSLAAGERWRGLSPVLVEGGSLRLRFEGDWKLNGLAVNPLVYRNEDYRLTRSYWNMTVEDPESARYGWDLEPLR
jgi:hypothetical protein